MITDALINVFIHTGMFIATLPIRALIVLDAIFGRR
jgi:hypothetical protein